MTTSIRARTPRTAHGLIGIALSETMMYTATGTAWSLEPRESGSGRWESLRLAFAEFVERESLQGSAIAVALLPPLAVVRVLDLPKMRDADLRAVLARSGGRYFTAMREPHVVVGARVNDPRPRQTSDEASEYVPYALAATPAALLEAIQEAASNAGVVIDRFVPGYAAWASIAPSRTRRAVQSMAIRRADGGIDVVHVAGGVATPIEIRRYRNGASIEVPRDAVALDRPEEGAARAVVNTRTLEFETPELRERRRSSQHRVMKFVIASAALVIVGVTGGTWWMTRRHLHDLEQRQAALAPSIAVARRAQAALGAVLTPAHALARMEEHGVVWSAALAQLSDDLPPDAYLESIHGSGDTLSVDGAAQNGAQVFQAVASSPLLAGSTPVGPIRRDMRADDPSSALERFTLMARIPNVVPPVPPARGKAR